MVAKPANSVQPPHSLCFRLTPPTPFPLRVPSSCTALCVFTQVIGGASEFDSRSLLKLLQPHITDPEKETRDKVKAARTSALASVSTARDAYLAAKSAAATAPFKLSAPLAVIVGKGEASRTDIIKALWAYVKTNKLQLEDKKNVIRVDEPLRKVCACAHSLR